MDENVLVEDVEVRPIIGANSVIQAAHERARLRTQCLSV